MSSRMSGYPNILCLITLLLCGFSYPSSDTLTPEQKRGKQIYTSGVSPSGSDLIALMSGIEVPGSVLPCIGCHGERGEGNPEGGIIPSNLTWANLTRPYSVQSSNGREHPPYDERSLISAISLGKDPAGNELHSAMPKYQMSKEDASDLIEYLKVLGLEKIPGISEDELRIGILPPPGPSLQPMRGAVKGVLDAYFTELNNSGGIYDRNVHLTYADLNSLEDREEDVRAFIESNDLFALTSSFFTGADEVLTNLANDLKVPVVGAIADYPQADALDNRYAFYLYPGVMEQLSALVSHTNKIVTEQSTKIGILYAQDDEQFVKLAERLKEQFEQLEVHQVRSIAFESSPEGLESAVAQLSREEIDHVFYLGAPVSNQFLFQSMAASLWFPNVYLPGSFTGPGLFELPKTFDGRIVLSYPSWPGMQEEIPLKFYFNLVRKYNLPDAYRNMQLTALGTAMLMMDTLKKCGRDITREDLILQLEQSYKVHTGLIPDQTFNMNQRIGSTRVFIAAVDLEHQKMNLLN